MPSDRPRLLYVTDPAYPARGRRYGDEDLALSARLREDFTVALCHPLDAAELMAAFDVVLIRNSGPVTHYQAAFDAFRDRALAGGVRVQPPLTGRGDMAGKGYLAELSAAGYPVIPTAARREDLAALPAADEYAVKPLRGADSHGLVFLPPDRLGEVRFGDVLVQPRIRFRYEVSFYFVDRVFQYALYAPRPEERWRLEPYEAGPEDLRFARRFVEWNPADHGVQRVDACRTADGELLLVELEDLNPYLSLDLVDEDTRERFVAALKSSLHRLAAGGRETPARAAGPGGPAA
ncbi:MULTISPECIES: hypothetical protein [Streptomyces]|uniref:hypothetical protein n=1 Tax=Streptomyces TaxID=1883 RepID=UPI001D136D67|nr:MULTISPECIES: hypothetical protein [Streptomyces]MCC3655631.1 hypothetical protein [Streptomyces sp. S07_1.15]WSQ70056.1 hypothetical protein OG463_00530 [Streptomyces xinghaiensis]